MRTIVIHCSDSPQGRGDNAETIHRWHLQRSFSGIGYHKVILEDGTIENGRPLYWAGAHVRSHNTDTIGICLIGVDSFTKRQFAALHYLLFKLKEKYPNASIVGHRDLDPSRTCPNFDVSKWLSDIGFS